MKQSDNILKGYEKYIYNKYTLFAAKLLEKTLEFVKILIKIERRFSCLGGVWGRSFWPALMHIGELP